MIKELHDTAPAKGVEKVFVPGEIEYNTSIKMEQDGIPLPESVYDYIIQKSCAM